MPKRFERHARSAWEWGAPGSRCDELARAVNDDPAKKPPGKKDPARCKSARGGPHVPAIVLDKYAAALGSNCEWVVPWLPRENDDPRWQCRHHEECANCGKVLRPSVEPGECPGFREPTEEERAAIAEALARIRERLAQMRRRPVINGPQGYRRKRD